MMTDVIQLRGRFFVIYIGRKYIRKANTPLKVHEALGYYS